MHPTQSERQEMLEATGRFRLDALCCRVAFQPSDMCHLCLSVSVAFLGDIALDEEDMRSFKVDRVIDLAQRTVYTVNHTDSGNNKRQHCFQDYSLRRKVLISAPRQTVLACHFR